jgi:ribosome maturation factor RimP
MPAKAAPKETLIGLLAPVVSGAGAELEDVSVSRAGSRSVVRVVIDRDGGIDLDGVAGVSHAVSAALDADPDVMAGSFVLEVTTPGVDRPLTQPRHWRRAQGRLVTVTRRGAGPLTGRVSTADDESAVLVGADLPGGRVAVAYGEVSRAVVQVEFNGPDPYGTVNSVDTAS